jgi:glycosyltransferase involved in cell wall biosynthesis
VEQVGYAGVLAAIVGKLFQRARIILSTGDAVHALAKSCMNPLQAQAMGVMEFTALRMADAVIICGTPYHKELLESQGLRNVYWIPGGVDSSLFKPMDVGGLRAELGLVDKLTIGVVGSITLNRKHQFCYGWEVIEVVRRLRGLPVVGLIVGVGDGVAFLRQRAKEYGIEDQVIFTGWVEHDALPRYLNLMDVCISTQSNDLVGQVRITAKVPEYLACGRFIIASDVGGAKTFVRDSGLLVAYEGVKDERYVEAVASHVRKICDDRSILRSGLKGVDTAKKYFDYLVLRPELRRVIESLRSR